MFNFYPLLVDKMDAILRIESIEKLKIEVFRCDDYLSLILISRDFVSKPATVFGYLRVKV